MSDVTVHFRDGTKQLFRDTGRPGGSWSQRVEYRDSFVVVVDCWENQTAFPMDLVQRVEVEAPRGGW